MKLVAFAGSSSPDSYNRKLVEYISKNFSSQSVTIEVATIAGIPLFNQDEAKKATPPAVAALNAAIEQADGVIIATPEHNHTLTAALKSTLEWLSFQLHPFTDKPVWLVGASYYDQGTSRAQLVARQVLEAPGVNALVMPGSEFLLANVKQAFTPNGTLKDKRTANFLAAVFNRFCQWVLALRQLATDYQPQTAGAEDLNATHLAPSSVRSVPVNSDDWRRKAAIATHAAFGRDYVLLRHGLMTVEQLDMMLQALPQALQFIAENNQIVYSKPTTSGTAPVPGASLAAGYPKQYHATLQQIIHELRTKEHSEKQVALTQKLNEKYVLQTYQAAVDQMGKYRGVTTWQTDYWQIVEEYLARTNQKVSRDYVVPGADSRSFSTGTPAATQADTTTSASVHQQTAAVQPAPAKQQADTTTSASVHADTATKPAPQVAQKLADTTTSASVHQQHQPAPAPTPTKVAVKPAAEHRQKRYNAAATLPTSVIF